MHVEIKRIEETRINLIVTQTIRNDMDDYEIDCIVACFKKYVLQQRELLQKEISDEKIHVSFDR